jgi:hypothetical protein
MYCPTGNTQAACDADADLMKPTSYSEKSNWAVAFNATLRSCAEDNFVPCIMESMDFGPSANSYPVLHHSMFPCLQYESAFYYAELTTIRDPYPVAPEITVSIWKYYSDTTADGVTIHHFSTIEGNVVLYGHKSNKNLGSPAQGIAADDEYDNVPYIFFSIQMGALEGTPTVAPTLSIMPSPRPTPQPTITPTGLPTLSPSSLPTLPPSPQPSPQPTFQPTPRPSTRPSLKPTPFPTFQPTQEPTTSPSPSPTPQPTPQPTWWPTSVPTSLPTPVPSYAPTPMPTVLCYSGFYVGDDPDGRAPSSRSPPDDEYIAGTNEDGPFCHSNPNSNTACTGASSYRQCSRCPLGRVTNFTGPPYPTSCELCPAGRIRETLTATFCKTCISGKFATSERLRCVQCAPGEYVNLTALACVGCTKGRYAPQAVEDQCLRCAAGMYTKGVAWRATACSDCSPGLAAVAFSVNCTTCQAGQYSGTRAENCLNCSVHKFNLDGITTVRQDHREEGKASLHDSLAVFKTKYFYFFTSVTCVSRLGRTCVRACAASLCIQTGKVSAIAEAASCTNCGAGQFAFLGRTACTLCPRGQYSGEQAGFCPFCDKGYIAYKPGTVDCTACPAGT